MFLTYNKKPVAPINEAYFGKTKGVKKIEEAIKALRHKYKFDPKKGMDNKKCKEIMDDKLFENFCDAIKDAFGFEKVYGGFDTENYLNAYTYPITEERYGLMYDRFETTEEGIRFKKELHAKSMIVATAPLFFNSKLTSAELTAIFLHEIGHSFKQAVIPVETCLDLLKDGLNFVIFNFLSITRHTAQEMLRSPLETITNLIAVIKASPEAKERIRKRWPSLFEKLWRFQANISPSTRYIDEKFADHFATMYGYGTELSSSLVKIDYDIKNTGFPPKDFFQSFLGCIDLTMDLMFDSHPVLAARLKSTINILEREIDKNNNLPKSEKDRIRKQIRDINVLALQYQNLDKTSDYSFAKTLYFRFVYNNLKDGDMVSKFLTRAYNLDLVDQKINDAKKKE